MQTKTGGNILIQKTNKLIKCKGVSYPRNEYNLRVNKSLAL